MVLDPLLPAPLGAPEEYRDLVACMDAYDRLGRTLWRGWLGKTGTPAPAAPADVRALAGALYLPEPMTTRETRYE